MAYGNMGYADEKAGWVNTDAVDPERYLPYAQTWPAQIVGGCRGTTPGPIRKLCARRKLFEAVTEFRQLDRTDS